MQAQYLRDLNRSGQYETVIQLFEADRLAHTEEVFGQYVKALARADKLSGTALMQTLYRGAQSYLGHPAAAAAGTAPADDLRVPDGVMIPATAPPRTSSCLLDTVWRMAS